MAAADIKIKFDLHGSTQTKGVTSRRYDRATRSFRATGADNDDQILNKVISEAIRRAGPFHHAASRGFDPAFGTGESSRDLPLHRVYAERFGLQVRGILHYGFDRWSLPQDSRPDETASFAGGFEAIDSYRYPYALANPDVPKFSDPRGLPDGEIYGKDVLDLTNKQEGRPQRKHSWTYFHPVVKVEVRATLNLNPIGLVFPLQRKVNSDAVVFAGYPFPAHTIRFDYVKVIWTSSPLGDNYSVLYRYTIMRGGHYRHFVEWKPNDPKDPDGPGIWDIVEGLAYDEAPFVNQFPY